MALTLITPATGPVVQTADAKAWCRVEGAGSDNLIAMLVESATRQVEELAGIALGEQTWELTLDAFSDAIELTRGPVIEIATDGFTYVDEAGDSQVVDPALYTLDIASDPQWIVRNSDASWPATMDAINVVKVRFVTGYAELPAPLEEAILRLVAQAFDNRDSGSIPARVMELIEPWRKLWITV